VWAAEFARFLEDIGLLHAPHRPSPPYSAMRLISSPGPPGSPLLRSVVPLNL